MHAMVLEGIDQKGAARDVRPSGVMFTFVKFPIILEILQKIYLTYSVPPPVHL